MKRKPEKLLIVNQLEGLLDSLFDIRKGFEERTSERDNVNDEIINVQRCYKDIMKKYYDPKVRTDEGKV